MTKSISKKQKEELREAVKGDPYYEKYAEELISLSNNLGKIKTLAYDELEKAKMELGLTHNVTKEMMKNHTIKIKK